MNPYLEMLKSVQAQHLDVQVETLDDYGLGGVECPICQNRGYMVYTKDGVSYSKECECMAKRRVLRRAKKSGMDDMLSRYTFGNYETPDTSRQDIKQIAEMYCEADKGWFFISGRSGSGKTHICTAICNRLIERGNDLYYMAWRDDSRKFKALMNTEELDEKLDPLKRIKVLYIDDFLKGGCNDADIRLAFEIINDRYNDTRLRTIISTEATLDALLRIDEALGSRIVERSRGYICRAPKENWRLR